MAPVFGTGAKIPKAVTSSFAPRKAGKVPPVWGSTVLCHPSQGDGRSHRNQWDVCAGPSWEEQPSWAGHGPVPQHTVRSQRGPQTPSPDVLSVSRCCTTQASVILVGSFCRVSLETFPKGSPCSVSFAVPAAITRVGDHKHLSRVQALGQQPFCTAAAGLRTGSRPQLSRAEDHGDTCHATQPLTSHLACAVLSDFIFRKPGSEALPRAGRLWARLAAQLSWGLAVSEPCPRCQVGVSGWQLGHGSAGL